MTRPEPGEPTERHEFKHQPGPDYHGKNCAECGRPPDVHAYTLTPAQEAEVAAMLARAPNRPDWKWDHDLGWEGKLYRYSKWAQGVIATFRTPVAAPEPTERDREATLERAVNDTIALALVDAEREIARLNDLLAKARAEGAAEHRRSVVWWLLNTAEIPEGVTAVRRALPILAEKINRGDHLAGKGSDD